jgi:hypothetical protein
MILYLDLYVEHFINELAKHNKIKSISIKDKAKDLIASGVIEKKYADVIVLLCDIRNRMIHDLRPDFPLLEKWIYEFVPAIDMDDAFSKAFAKLTPWSRVQLYAIPTIFYLFKKARQIKKEAVKHDIRIRLVRDSFVFEFVKKM